MTEATIDSELLPFAQPDMRRAFKKHLTLASRELFEQQTNSNNDANAKGHNRQSFARMYQRTLALLDDIFNVLRKGAVDPALRHLELTDLSQASGKFYPQFTGLTMINADEIALAVCSRYVKHERMEKLEGEGKALGNWIRLLTESEREACIKDLKFEKIDKDAKGPGSIDFIASVWLNTIRFMFCKQMIIVAIGRGDTQGVDEFKAFVSSVVPFVEDLLAGTADENPDKAAGDEDQVDHNGNAGAPVPVATMRAALPGMLVIPPMPWSHLRTNWIEHFGELDVAIDGPESDDWAWLIDDAHYLITFPASLFIGGATAAVHHDLRRLVALSRCFRADNDWSAFVEHYGDADHVLHHANPARCRMLAVPLEEPIMFSSKNFPPKKEQLELLSPRRGEFRMAGRPFVDPKELLGGWLVELSGAWEWLRRDQSETANRLRRSLEAFEIGCTLGRIDEVPPVHREGWQLVALMTAAESLLCRGRSEYKQSEIDDSARRALRASKESGATVDKCCSCLRRAYQLRNEFVHTGVCAWDSGELAEVRRTFALILRAELRNAVPKPLSPSDQATV